MKVLFLTSYGCPISGEHYFTKGVWEALCERFEKDCNEILLATVFYVDGNIRPYIVEERYRDKIYYKFYCPTIFDEKEQITEISNFFSFIAPDVIHANMTKRYEIVAAQNNDIPIILTIHLGDFICPRGGLHGLMNYADRICVTSVGNHCLKCCAADLPISAFSYLLYRIIPNKLLSWAYKKVGKKNLFYISQFLGSYNELVLRQKFIEHYKYATIIAANQRLKDILALNGLGDNVVLLPHGVKSRQQYPLPEIKDVVKFFYFGRIQYAKGLHILLDALDGIDKSLYELHIVGEIPSGRKSKRYMEQLVRSARNKNVVFHKTIDNENIEAFIKDMHVMIHPAILLEVYGVSIAESLSIGRPVLATRCGGAEMQIQDGVNGWLVAPNDIVALHDKIMEIINDKDQIVQMSKSCRLPHPLPEYAENLTRIYTELAK